MVLVLLVLGRKLCDGRQALEHLRGRGRAPSRILTEQRHHQVGQRRGQVRHQLPGSGRPALPKLGQIAHRPRRVGIASRQQQVRQRAQRIEIAARVERLHVHGFRRHERRRADDPRARSDRHQRAEVDQLAATLGGAPQVTGAHVAVHHAARVDQRQRRGQVAEQLTDLPLVERRVLDRVARVPAFQQLHRVVRCVAVLPVLEGSHDAWMRELHEGVVLALEHRLHRGVGLIRDDDQLLQGEPLPGVLVQHAVDAAHAAAAEPRFDAIATVDRALLRRGLILGAHG
jgi:hypothetical protein